MTGAAALAALLPATMALAQRRDPDWVQWVLVAVFFGFPIVARIVRALLQKAGLAPPEAEAGEDPRERMRRLREERRRAEAEGEDLWRRLARGEVAEPLPTVTDEPPPSARARRREAEPEPGRVLEEAQAESSLELEAEPAPLAVLGGISEPSEAAETSLEGSSEPAPLAAFDSAGLGAEPAEPAPRVRAAFSLRPGDMRRAVVLSEVLGPPLSERGARA